MQLNACLVTDVKGFHVEADLEWPLGSSSSKLRRSIRVSVLSHLHEQKEGYGNRLKRTESNFYDRFISVI